MSFDLKQIKKLADTCRKAGITHFKNAELEFTLSESLPTSSRKSRISNTPLNTTKDDIKSDSLSKEELLFWSTGVVEDLTKEQ